MRPLTPWQRTLAQIINITLKHNKVSGAEAAEMMMLDKVEYVTMIRAFDVAWMSEMRLMTILTMLLRFERIKLPPTAEKELEKIAREFTP